MANEIACLATGLTANNTSIHTNLAHWQTELLQGGSQRLSFPNGHLHLSSPLLPSRKAWSARYAPRRSAKPSTTMNSSTMPITMPRKRLLSIGADETQSAGPSLRKRPRLSSINTDLRIHLMGGSAASNTSVIPSHFFLTLFPVQF